MLDRMMSCLVAISLALLVWLYARSRDQEILDNVPVPVQITLAASQADQYSLEVNRPSQVMVSFTGPPHRIRELRGQLQRNELHVVLVITVPDERLNESRYSDTIVVETSDLHTPPGVTAMLVEGKNRLPVTLHRFVERRLPVRLDLMQEEQVGPVVFEPATVLVHGPQEVLDRARYITTQASEMPARSANAPANAATVGRLSVVQSLEGRPVTVVPSRVTVRLPPRAYKLYDLTDVPVRFLCPANFMLTPEFYDAKDSKRTLRLRGPVQEALPCVYAFVDLTKGRYTSGLTHEFLQIQLPRDFHLEQEVPRIIGFKLSPADFVPLPLGSLPDQ